MNSEESSGTSSAAPSNGGDGYLTAGEAAAVAAALKGEVGILKDEIAVLRQVDNFKARVYVVAIVAAVFEIAAFAGLWWVSRDMNADTRAIRTDLEVHRIRNEASHDCLAEKMAKLPPPEARTTDPLTRQFLHEFLGCVADTAPTIVPPGAPDIRVTTRDERKGTR